MKIQIIGIEKPFELKVKSKSGALFSISEKKEITIQFITKVKEDIYYKGMINPNITIVIQKGFKTDLTTVPQIFWRVIIYKADLCYYYVQSLSINLATKKAPPPIPPISVAK